jgi:hypothetical protein
MFGGFDSVGVPYGSIRHWNTAATSTEIVKFSSTGLAVTGTLSASGLSVLSGGALIPADGYLYGNSISGPNYNRIRLYNGATGDIDYYASFPTGSHKFYNGGSDTLIGTFSSTGLAVTGTLSASGTLSTGTGTGATAGLKVVNGTSGVGSGYGAIYAENIAPSASNYYLAGFYDGNGLALNSGTNLYLQIGGATIAQITSTGLAVTGTLSATGAISNSVVGGSVNTFTGSAAAQALAQFESTGNGGLWVGKERAAGGAIMTGSTGYAGVIVTTTNAPIEFGINDSKKMALSSTALTLGTGVNLVAASDIKLQGGASLQIYSLAGGTDHHYYLQNGGGAGAGNASLAFVEAGVAVSMTLTGDALTLGTGVNLVMASGQYIEGGEGTAPAAPAANGFRIFAEDNGAGKTRLMVQFATGAAQQLAIEP